MNPHQQNKVDISSLSPDEQRLLRLYGKVPTKKDLLQNKLKERKYFDSGDYALSKAGKASDIGVTNVGSRHPVPENIPHLTSTSPGANNPAGNNGNNGGGAGGGGGAGPGTSVTQAHPIPGTMSGHPGSVSFQSRSPIKEASFLQRGTAVDDSDNAKKTDSRSGQKENDEASVSPPPAKEGVPIPQ